MRQASRRAFLRAAVVASGAVVVPTSIATRANALTVKAGRTRLRRSVFTPLVGSTFMLRTPAGTAYRAVLAEVSDSTRAKGHQTSFGLTFRIAGAARPADGTYTMTHATLRPFDLYVGGVGMRHRGLYEAVVNA